MNPAMTHSNLILKALVPATARGEATRRRLLSAAEIEFGARGFHAASVSSITTRADVGQGTFYLYFHSKEEIFLSLVKEIGRSMRAYTAKAVARASSRLEAERMGLVALLEFTLEHPGLYRIVQESQFVDETVFRDYFERFAKGYAQDLSDAADRGELKVSDAETRAWAIMGISQYLGMRHCLWTGKLPSPQVIDTAMEMIEGGISQHGRI